MYKQDIKYLEHCAAVNCDCHVRGEEIQAGHSTHGSSMRPLKYQGGDKVVWDSDGSSDRVLRN